MSLTKDQAIPLIALVVTLTVAHGLKLQMNNQLSLENFNKKWALSAGGLVVGHLVNTLATGKILDAIAKDERYVKKGTNKEEQLSYILLKDIVETGIMLLVAQVVQNVGNGEDISLTPSLFRNIFLAISGILFYDIVVRPAIPVVDDKGNKTKYGHAMREVAKKTMSIAAADYMADLDFDNFGVEAGTTAAGIVIGDLSSTPIADKLFDAAPAAGGD